VDDSANGGAAEGEEAVVVCMGNTGEAGVVAVVGEEPGALFEANTRLMLSASLVEFFLLGGVIKGCFCMRTDVFPLLLLLLLLFVLLLLLLALNCSVISSLLVLTSNTLGCMRFCSDRCCCNSGCCASSLTGCCC
jgi:hypothetical protein